MNFRENSARCGILIAGKAVIRMDFSTMGMMNKLSFTPLSYGLNGRKLPTLRSRAWKSQAESQEGVEVDLGGNLLFTY